MPIIYNILYAYDICTKILLAIISMIQYYKTHIPLHIGYPDDYSYPNTKLLLGPQVLCLLLASISKTYLHYCF